MTYAHVSLCAGVISLAKVRKQQTQRGHVLHSSRGKALVRRRLWCEGFFLRRTRPLRTQIGARFGGDGEGVVLREVGSDWVPVAAERWGCVGEFFVVVVGREAKMEAEGCSRACVVGWAFRIESGRSRSHLRGGRGQRGGWRRTKAQRRTAGSTPTLRNAIVVSSSSFSRPWF